MDDGPGGKARPWRQTPRWFAGGQDGLRKNSDRHRLDIIGERRKRNGAAGKDQTTTQQEVAGLWLFEEQGDILAQVELACVSNRRAMTMVGLTQGAVPELVYSRGIRSFRPILQVSQLKRCNEPGRSQQPWMMGLSDGELFAVAIVTPARAHIVESPQGVQQYSIVELFDWQTEIRGATRVIVVKNWLHLETRRESIGLPVRHKEDPVLLTRDQS